MTSVSKTMLAVDPNSLRPASLKFQGSGALQRFTIGLMLIAAATVGGLLIWLAPAHRHVIYVFAGIGAVVIVGLLFYVPLKTLPAITLAVTLLIPTDTLLLPHQIVGQALGVIPLLVWILRSRKSVASPVALQLAALLLCAWMVLSQTFARLYTHHGWAWLITATVAMVLTIMMPPDGLSPQRLRKMFLAITTPLAIYGVIEGFVIHKNILFQPILEHTVWWRGVHTSVSYRITTILGHPLVNATIFSVAAILTATDWLEKREHPYREGARLLVLIGAVVATHSRGAAVGLAVGLIFVFMFTRIRHRAAVARRLAFMMCALIASTLLIVGVRARDESTEGQKSAATRIAVLTRAAETLHENEPFGVGPDESDAYRSLMRLPGYETPLENSYAQLAVSLGPIGTLLFVGLLMAVVVVGLRGGAAVGEALALLTLLIDIGGYNAIENYRPLLIVIALLLVAILTGRISMIRTRRMRGRAVVNGAIVAQSVRNTNAVYAGGI